MSDILCTVKTPDACAPPELNDFVSFVLAGGEVTPTGLLGRVQRAHSLAFLRSRECLIGVAGLKRPSDNHRNEVSVGSGVNLQTLFPLELGWVFVLPSARGGKSSALCGPLLEATANLGIFATSRSGNIAMHKTLEKYGFARVGKEWPSGQNPDNLCLFTRHAA
jgi:hypothetical protein